MKSITISSNNINSELLNIMCCPECKGSLKQQGNKLKCSKCKKSFAIKDGTPYMLIKK